MFILFEDNNQHETTTGQYPATADGKITANFTITIKPHEFHVECVLSEGEIGAVDKSLTRASLDATSNKNPLRYFPYVISGLFMNRQILTGDSKRLCLFLSQKMSRLRLKCEAFWSCC